MTSAGHVTFNSNAVLPVSESGVKICYFVQPPRYVPAEQNNIFNTRFRNR